MKEYKLSDFGLNKQSLKRKLKEITDLKLKKELENILNTRTTTYSLLTIEYLVKGFYSNVSKNVDEPLSVYYSIQNKEKFKTLQSLIEIKKSGSMKNVLEKDIRKIIEKSHDEYSTNDEYTDELNTLAGKYGILPNEVIKLAIEIENEWLEKIL